MQAVSTRPFVLYWKQYMRRMRSGDETRVSLLPLGVISVAWDKASIMAQYTKVDRHVIKFMLLWNTN